jgi:hypothetical protein
LIHPIAGKCKHCKADLASFHAARQPASAPLPALGATAAPPAKSPGHVHWNPGRVDTAPAPAPHAHAVEAEPRGGWRSWPVIVIALAMIAIVAAVVLMVWPSTTHSGGEAKHTLGAPPAPERMDTAPEVTAPSAPSAPHAQRPNAAPPPARDPWATPDDPTDDTPDAADHADAVDPFADPSPAPGKPSPRNRLGLNAGASIVLSMAVHVCRKARQCATSVDIPAATLTMCDALRGQPIAPPPRCPAATRCLAQIDALSCDGADLDPRQAGTLLNQLVDCSEATQC